MATSKKILHDALRTQFMSKISDFLKAEGEEVLVVGSNEIALPCVDAEGNDEFMVLTFKVPLGSRDGDTYDGYGMARDYEMHLKDKEEKAKVAAEKKARKIEADRKMREEKARLKTEREAERN